MRRPTKQQRPTPAEQPFEGMPTDEPKPPTAGDLVAAWCAGFKDWQGCDPDPSVVRRVAGVCRAIARDRTDDESWRTAWRAALAAGRMGRFDVVAVLATGPTPQTRGRGNHYIALAQNNAAAAPQASRLGAALGQLRELPPAAGQQS